MPPRTLLSSEQRIRLFGISTDPAEMTRREHAVELQRYLGLRRFGLADWRACLRVGTDAAWATDRGEPIVRAMLAHLRANGVLLPAPAVLERIGLAARARARKKTFEAITSGLSDAERGTLTGLLSVDPELRRSRFAWLRDYSESPAPSNIAVYVKVRGAIGKLEVHGSPAPVTREVRHGMKH